MHWTQDITIRMLGDNITLMRCAWQELRDELKDDSPLKKRITERLEYNPEIHRSPYTGR